MSVSLLKDRRFVIKKLEDEYFVFKRKPTTPPHVLLFPEEADRMHEAGHDVFAVEPSVEYPERYVLRVFPNPFKLIRENGYWVRKLGTLVLHIANSSFGRPYLPEVEPGAVGFLVMRLNGTIEQASYEALAFIQSLGQPGFIFDFSENHIHIIHKQRVN